METAARTAAAPPTVRMETKMDWATSMETRRMEIQMVLLREKGLDKRQRSSRKMVRNSGSAIARRVCNRINEFNANNATPARLIHFPVKERSVRKNAANPRGKRRLVNKRAIRRVFEEGYAPAATF